MIKHKHICFIGNFPSHYREPIFKLMDVSFDIEWHFMEQDTSIKPLNINKLKKAVIEKSTFIRNNTWYFQHNVLKLAFKTNIDTYLIVGEPYSISSWILVRLIKMFYPKKKVYYWTHGWYGKESKIRKFVKRLFFKPADGIFLYGEYAKRLMMNEGFEGEKLHVIHNSLDYKKQLCIRDTMSDNDIFVNHFKNKCYNLIFIGRITTVKHLDQLIEALAILNKNEERYNLTIVGDGSEKKYLMQLADDLRISGNIWFYGACYDENVNAKLIYNADLCVSPGNVGLTAMHTMVYGTPVITHDTFKWQMPEFEAIKRGKTGDFFTFNSVDSMVLAIEKWFNKNHDRRNIIRQFCYNEIDSNWTPEFQLNVLKLNLL